MTFIKYTSIIIYTILNIISANLLSVVADSYIVQKLQNILNSLTYILIIFNSQIVKNFFHFCCKMMTTFTTKIYSSNEYVSLLYNEILETSIKFKDFIVNGVMNTIDLFRTLTTATFESIKYVFSTVSSIGTSIFNSIIMNPINNFMSPFNKMNKYFTGSAEDIEDIGLQLVHSKNHLTGQQVLALINDERPDSLLVKYATERVKLNPDELKIAINGIFKGKSYGKKLGNLLNIINIDEEAIRTTTKAAISEIEIYTINGINEFIEKMQEKHSNLFDEYIKTYGLESLFKLLEEYPDEKTIVKRMEKALTVLESDICNKKVLVLLGILFFILYIFSIKLSYLSLVEL
jgi:hypothetical protein